MARKYHITARVYRSTKHPNYIDAYSIVLLYPRNWKESTRGCFLGCSPYGEDGVNRCCWDDVRRGDIINVCGLWLGKRQKIETLPKGFRNYVKRLEREWNKAINTNTEKAWEHWCQAV